MNHTEWLRNELLQLKKLGVLQEDAIENLRQYYGKEVKPGINWGMVLLSIIGTTLIGSGVILILAHNWDLLSRPARTFLSFIPLLIGQSAVLFTLYRKKDSIPWKEGAGILLFFAIGSSIALVGQTYHIEGDPGKFVLTWMLLSAPLIFILDSASISIFYLYGILFWTEYGRNELPFFYLFFSLLSTVAIIYLLIVLKRDLFSVRSLILTWAFSIWLAPAVACTFGGHVRGLWIVVYSSLFGSMYLCGRLFFDRMESLKKNPLRLIGYFVSLIICFILTFSDTWRDIGWDKSPRAYTWRIDYTTWQMDYVLAGLLLAGFLILAARYLHRLELESLVLAVPLLSTSAFAASGFGPLGSWMNWIYNLLFLALGCTKIWQGIQVRRLSTLNLGMIAVMVLIMARFFDSDLGLLTRGVIFIVLGSLFLGVNLFVSKSGFRSGRANG
ncbi:MAG: DUF2157 domain-containing protein [Candidatus Wallbacteria bacterium]|nr:DUF2157 domain-containing protein [Candidatus Wallbacteria bacterium]